MKTKLMKFFAISLIVVLVTQTSNFSFAQEDLNQASRQDLQDIQNLLDTAAETAFKENSPAAGNDFNLDIVWKANTLVPYDYKGKALPSALSSITFYAIADTPNPDGLVYTWLIDDISSNKEGPELQGRGKSTFNWFTFQIPEFTHELRVYAQDATGHKGSASLEIKTAKPEAYLYIANNNNYNNSVFDSLKFAPGRETSLLVRPFYFNLFNIEGLDFLWRLNGKENANTGSRKDILPLNISTSALTGAYSNLRLELKNSKQKNNIFDSANVNVSINIVK